uniref:Uncharacterized protein n=1 Tax=Arundo donax TaxID=35708 RepID=A0A0A9HIZ2_ARUDO
MTKPSTQLSATSRPIPSPSALSAPMTSRARDDERTRARSG